MQQRDVPPRLLGERSCGGVIQRECVVGQKLHVAGRIRWIAVVRRRGVVTTGDKQRGNDEGADRRKPAERPLRTGPGRSADRCQVMCA